jgi:undecaprenyl-diphosphatase
LKSISFRVFDFYRAYSILSNDAAISVNAMNRQSYARALTFLGFTGSLGLIACLLLLAGLIWLSQEVWEKETLQFDTAFLLRLHQGATPVLDHLMLSITRLGNPAFVVGVVLVHLGWFMWRRRRLEALMLITTCAGAVVLNKGLKLFFARPRPALWTSLIQEKSYGFPSGHALGAIVLYGFLAYVFALWYPRQAQWIYCIAISTIALVGFSRLYLGVHYPTDVAAGFGIGFIWLMLCVFMLRVLTCSWHRKYRSRQYLQ